MTACSHHPTETGSSPLTRRLAVTGAFAATALHAATRTAAAGQGATPEPDDVSYLFVQVCESGSAIANEGAGLVYELTLQHASGQTLFFSDRPERIAGIVPTAGFLDDLAAAEGDPPNAALAFSPGGDGDEMQVGVVELMTPSADAEAGVISYQARLIDVVREQDGDAEAEAIEPVTELPASFGRATLFIDALVEPGQAYIIFDTYD